jgi:hypothetical protein
MVCPAKLVSNLSQVLADPHTCSHSTSATAVDPSSTQQQLDCKPSAELAKSRSSSNNSSRAVFHQLHIPLRPID